MTLRIQCSPRRAGCAVAIVCALGVLVGLGWVYFVYGQSDHVPNGGREVPRPRPSQPPPDPRQCWRKIESGAIAKCQLFTADFSTTWWGQDSDDNRQHFESLPSDDQVSLYRWTFGDGGTDDHPRAIHTYDAPGVYEVTLMMESKWGVRDIITQEVVVNPVRTYAPEVHLHPDERRWPADPGEFVARSSLNWARPQCERGDDVVVAVGRIDPRRLGEGGYTHASTGQGCASQGPLWSTRDLTAPARDGNRLLNQPEDSARVGKRGQGFYLNVDRDYLSGRVPGTPTSRYLNAPALYYDYLPHRYIVYWFFYAMNERNGDKHQGDWERLVVRLNGDDTAFETAYYQHYCNPLVPRI